MSNTTTEIFEKYQVRKSTKQKKAFEEYVKTFALEKGFSFKVEKNFLGVRNLVVGDPDSAKVIYTAHYDTCAALPFPNFITPKSFLIYLLYQLLICFVAFAVAFVAGFITTQFGPYSQISYQVLLLLIFVFCILLVCGPANKHTANDNTSGVTTLLDIMNDLPETSKQKVAFVFFDLEEAGVIGSTCFAIKHRKFTKNTLLINFDCVSDGKHILIALKKGARKYKDSLVEAFKANENVTVEIATKGVFYPSDQTNFHCGVGVAALKRSKFLNLLYMNRIHTPRDTVYREENVEFLKNSSIALLELI